jgi:hypothetical protein
LTAEFAIQGPVKISGNLHIHAAIHECEFPFSLDLVAYAHAHSATYAQVHVETYEMGLVVGMEVSGFPLKGGLGNLILMNQFLEPAIAARVATGTKQRVGAEQ